LTWQQQNVVSVNIRGLFAQISLELGAATYCNNVLMLLDSKSFAFQAWVQALLDLPAEDVGSP
jgi:hypothetical protein